MNGSHISSANQCKDQDVEKIGTVSKRGKLIKSSVENATEVTKSDAITIKDEKDIQIKVPNAATEKELKELVVDIEKKAILPNQWEKHH